MTSALPRIVLGFLAACFVSCASPGDDATRVLSHVYQDQRGLTIVNVFDMDGVARGGATTFGEETSRRTLTLPLAEFERLWNQLDEAEISRFAIAEDDEKVDALNNYVILKGTMPRGSKSTYAIPKTKASAKTKNWVKAFRAITRG